MFTCKMSTVWSLIRCFGLFLLVLTGMLSAVHPVNAFEPGFDYWSIETITLEAVELPPEITVEALNLDGNPRVTVIIENQSETLLYVLSLNYKDVLVMVTPDPNWEARVSMAHEVASYLVAPSQTVYLNLDALTDLDPELMDQNIFSTAPPPADILLPAPQSSQLLLVYTDQVFLVPFTLTYTLNTKYDNGSTSWQFWEQMRQSTESAVSTATQQAILSAQTERNETIIVGLAGIAILFLIGWLVWRLSTRGR